MHEIITMDEIVKINDKYNKMIDNVKYLELIKNNNLINNLNVQTNVNLNNVFKFIDYYNEILDRLIKYKLNNYTITNEELYEKVYELFIKPENYMIPNITLEEAKTIDMIITGKSGIFWNHINRFPKENTHLLHNTHICIVKNVGIFTFDITYFM